MTRLEAHSPSRNDCREDTHGTHGAYTEQLRAAPRKARLRRHQDRHHGQNGELADGQDVFLTLERRISILEKADEQDAKRQAAAGTDEPDLKTVRTERPLRNSCRIEHLELFADVAALEIRGELRLFAFGEQALIGTLKGRI